MRTAIDGLDHPLERGLPLDLVIVKRDQLAVARHASIDTDNGYFHNLRSLWSEAFARLPEPD